MSAEKIQRIVGELLEEIDRRIECAVDERVGLLREEFVKGGPTADSGVGELGDALDVAGLLGLDLSTEAKRKSARNRVYYLASVGSIPAVRLSPKRVRFDLDKARRIIAASGVGNL